MDKTDSAPSPVIQGLTTILQDACPDLDDWEFKSCVAKTAITGKRCKKPLGSSKLSEVQDLWRQFGLMIECPETNEFLDQVAGFFAASHCSSHKRNSDENLRRWTQVHVTAISLLSVQGLTIYDNYDNKVNATTTIHVTPMTPTVESSIQISSGAKGIQVSVHATAVTNAASTETIAVNSPGTNNNLRKDTVPATEKIIGHNQEIIQRNELKKAHASVLLEMQTPPTPAEAQRGIVYVQEHELGNGLFKIGWMEDTARVSIMHCESCSLPNSRVIYETPSGPFLAASKAKSLSQTALHPQTLGNRECHHCGRGCEEWVSAPVETVLEAVKTMEAFVKLPAYESKDGENWKLSSAADKMIRTMSVFSLERFKDTMDSAEENSTGKTVASLATRLSQETIACVDETVASPVSPNTETDFQEKETPTKSETKGSSKDSKSRRRFLANPAKKGKKIIDYMANLTGWDRSAESTPER